MVVIVVLSLAVVAQVVVAGAVCCLTLEVVAAWAVPSEVWGDCWVIEKSTFDFDLSFVQLEKR